MTTKKTATKKVARKTATKKVARKTATKKVARKTATKKVANDITRERWLMNLANELNTAVFNNKMPLYQITCGFPSKGGLAKKKRVIGQCWNPCASNDGKTTQIIMTITEDNPMVIAATVAHEMVHAIVGTEAGHGKPFRDLATKIGLEGKMTATTAGNDFIEVATPILEKLGAYPHSALDASQQKKQTTRNCKASCPDCGYTVRASRKWLELGAPLCALHSEPVLMTVE